MQVHITERWYSKDSNPRTRFRCAYLPLQARGCSGLIHWGPEPMLKSGPFPPALDKSGSGREVLCLHVSKVKWSNECHRHHLGGKGFALPRHPRQWEPNQANKSMADILPTPSKPTHAPSHEIYSCRGPRLGQKPAQHHDPSLKS